MSGNSRVKGGGLTGKKAWARGDKGWFFSFPFPVMFFGLVLFLGGDLFMFRSYLGGGEFLIRK